MAHINKLLIVAILCSVMGVLIILFVAERTNVELVSISEIDDSFIEKEIRVQGKVVSFKQLEKVALFSVSDGEEIKVVIFDEIDLKNGYDVEVVGKVVEYKGELEMEGNLVRII